MLHLQGNTMSKKDTWYRQCIYEMKTGEGKKVDTSWIPETLAKVGKKIWLHPEGPPEGISARK